ncbi:MAG: HEAT repeat domain-containing protein [Candidatus Brocadiae bacterium]|nr:HEAT repeat domain-containing protein [Candidatus Brocadiia bacterium]
MFTIRPFATRVVCLAAVALALAAGHARAAEATKEQKLIQVLQSDAPPQQKAITCKHLAIYGSEAAVPALAPLLADEQLASWARIALEAIPGPKADAALRDAMAKLKGRLLIGTINSIAVRRDAEAVAALVIRLKDADADVACAAAEALGRIGGATAVKALEQALPAAPAPVRSSVAIGCVFCAERLLADGKAADAVRLYDAVRKADVPKQRHLEATRGAILARGDAGVPMLLEQLRSADKALYGIGLRTARELSGAKATEALAAELATTKPDRQAFLLLALADRSDPKALPAVLQVAKAGPKPIRLVAIGALQGLGNASCIPALLDLASETDADIAQAAKVSLARLPGQDVNPAILASLPKLAGKRRQALIEVAMHRRIEAAMPAFVQCAEDTDAGVRSAAVAAIGVLGSGQQVPELVRILQKTQDAKEQAAVGKALRTTSARGGAACVPHLMPLMKCKNAPLRAIGLHALASAGGPTALAAVQAGIGDADPAVQDDAVRTLAGWPSNWPNDLTVMDPLLALAKTGKKDLHKILALRGYLQCVQAATKLGPADRLAKVDAVLPLVTRPDGKRRAISALATIAADGSLDRLAAFAAEPAVAEEACSAIVQLTGQRGLKGVGKEPRKKALQAVVQRSKNARTKKQATELLKKLR